MLALHSPFDLERKQNIEVDSGLIKIEKQEQLYEICRACHQKCNNFFLLSEHLSLEDDTSFANLLKLCTEIQAQEDDEFSQIICDSCQDKLRQWYDFRKMVQEADKLFRIDKLLPAENRNTSPVFEEVNIKIELPNEEENVNENLNGNVSVSNEVTDDKVSENTESEMNESINSDDDSTKDKDRITCPICNKSLMNRNLKFHVKKFHPDKHPLKGPLTCSIRDCDKTFLTKFRLDSHLSVQHKACRYCLTQFSSRSKLLTHLKQHSDQLRFACKVCGKRYHEIRHYQKHTLSHKHYSCKICEKLFTNLSRFQRHQKTHKDIKSFKCEICNKLFNQSNALKFHMAVHTTERNFSCDICGQSFKTNANLKWHLKKHNKDKELSCKVCFKTFNSKRGSELGGENSVCDVCGKNFLKNMRKKLFLITSVEKPSGKA